MSVFSFSNRMGGRSKDDSYAIMKELRPVVGPTIPLLKSDHSLVRQMGLSSIGALASQSPGLRDFILKQQSFVPSIVKCLEKDTDEKIMTSEVLFTLCGSSQPVPNFELIEAFIPAVKKVILQSNNNELSALSIWVLSVISEGPEQVETMLDVVPSLVCELNKWDLQITAGVLTTLNNIVLGKKSFQVKRITDADLAPLLSKLLHSGNDEINKLTAVLVKNMLCVSPDSIQSLFDGHVIQPLVDVLYKREKFDTQLEAALGVAALVSNGSPVQVSDFLKFFSMERFIELLSADIPQLQLALLDGLVKVLDIAETFNQKYEVIAYIKSFGGKRMISSLRTSSSQEVKVAAMQLLNNMI